MTTAKSTATLSRKEMKGPDKFQVATAKAFEWAATRRKALTAAAVALAVVAAGAALASYASDARSVKAGQLLFKVMDAADGEISSVPLPGLQKPLFKTEEEKQQAVVAAAEAVRKDHGGSAAGRFASLPLGDAQLRLGKPDQAIEAYEAYLREAPSDDSLRFAAQEGLAYAREAKGDLVAAAEAFQKMGALGPNLADHAALQRARVLLQGGKTADARAILEAFPNDFKDSTLKTSAAERLAKLGGASAAEKK